MSQVSIFLDISMSEINSISGSKNLHTGMLINEKGLTFQLLQKKFKENTALPLIIVEVIFYFRPFG